jgi:hypothetical protein
MTANNKLKLNDYLLNIKLKKSIKKTFTLFIDNLEKIDAKQLSKNLMITNSVLTNFIKYILRISLKSSNIFMHISDSLGNQINFYSIISLLKTKKSKIKKTEILNTFYDVLLTKHYKLLKNEKLEIISNKDLNFLLIFAEKVRKKLFLINIKFYNNIPYNGCRKRRND